MCNINSYVPYVAEFESANLSYQVSSDSATKHDIYQIESNDEVPQNKFNPILPNESSLTW